MSYSYKKMKVGRFIVAAIIVMMLAVVPISAYAGEYLQNARVSQAYTAEVSGITISTTRTIAPYINIKKVNKAGDFKYMFFEKDKSTYKLADSGKRTVVSGSTGSVLTSSKDISEGTIKISLTVPASYTNCQTDMVLNYLRCSY